MAEFSKLRYKEMLKEEIIAFGPDLKAIITPFDPVSLGIGTAFTQFNNQWAKLDSMLQDSTGSVITNDLIKLDEDRDRDLAGIKALAKAHLFHRNAAKQAAAELVINTMDGFDKNIARLPLPVQTKTVEELVKVFETNPAVTAALALLGLTEWVAPLKATNTEFASRYLVRIQETGDKPETNFVQEKPLAEAAYLMLLKVIDSKNTLEPLPVLDQMINQINELISKYNVLVAQRKSAAKSGQANTDGPANPTN